jgi:hypothetical protein
MCTDLSDAVMAAYTATSENRWSFPLYAGGLIFINCPLLARFYH